MGPQRYCTPDACADTAAALVPACWARCCRSSCGAGVHPPLCPSVLSPAGPATALGSGSWEPAVPAQGRGRTGWAVLLQPGPGPFQPRPVPCASLTGDLSWPSEPRVPVRRREEEQGRPRGTPRVPRPGPRPGDPGTFADAHGRSRPAEPRGPRELRAGPPGGGGRPCAPARGPLPGCLAQGCSEVDRPARPGQLVCLYRTGTELCSPVFPLLQFADGKQQTERVRTDGSSRQTCRRTRVPSGGSSRSAEVHLVPSLVWPPVFRRVQGSLFPEHELCSH